MPFFEHISDLVHVCCLIRTEKYYAIVLTPFHLILQVQPCIITRWASTRVNQNHRRYGDVYGSFRYKYGYFSPVSSSYRGVLTWSVLRTLKDTVRSSSANRILPNFPRIVPSLDPYYWPCYYGPTSVRLRIVLYCIRSYTARIIWPG